MRKHILHFVIELKTKGGPRNDNGRIALFHCKALSFSEFQRHENCQAYIFLALFHGHLHECRFGAVRTNQMIAALVNMSKYQHL